MAAKIPRHAIKFMAAVGRLAVKHGFKKGVARAAAKANPVLLVIEAAVSVIEAVDSHLTLSRAKEHRDGLARWIPHEEKRLAIERAQLSICIGSAREELVLKKELQKRLGQLVLACSTTYKLAWDELYAIRTSDLPDLERYDQQFERLESAWSDFATR